VVQVIKSTKHKYFYELVISDGVNHTTVYLDRPCEQDFSENSLLRLVRFKHLPRIHEDNYICIFEYHKIGEFDFRIREPTSIEVNDDHEPISDGDGDASNEVDDGLVSFKKASKSLLENLEAAISLLDEYLRDIEKRSRTHNGLWTELISAGKQMSLVHAQKHEVQRRKSIGIWADLITAAKRRHRRIQYKAAQAVPSSITASDRATLAMKIQHLRESTLLQTELNQRGLSHHHQNGIKQSIQQACWQSFVLPSAPSTTCSDSLHLHSDANTTNALQRQNDIYCADAKSDVDGVMQHHDLKGWMKLQSLLFDATAIFNFLGVKRFANTDELNLPMDLIHIQFEPIGPSMECDTNGVMKLHDIKGWLKSEAFEPHNTLTEPNEIHQLKLLELKHLAICEYDEIWLNVKRWLKCQMNSVIQIVGSGIRWIYNFVWVLSKLVWSLTALADLSGTMMLHDLTGWLKGMLWLSFSL
jgi:hypothetical protein